MNFKMNQIIPEIDRITDTRRDIENFKTIKENSTIPKRKIMNIMANRHKLIKT
jgi:hypothetical protein